MAYGFVQFLLYIKKYTKYFKATIIFVGLLLFINFFYFFRNYNIHYPYTFSGEWQYGYRNSIEYVRSVEKNFDNIYITSDMGRPYIYYLFYTKTDPKTFRKNSIVRRDAFGFVTVDRFGKYNFLNSETKISKQNNKNLFIQTSQNVPSEANILRKFYLLNGSISLVAYE